MYVGCFGCTHNLILGYDPAVVSISDVLGNAVVKQDGLLGHNPELGSEPLEVEFLCLLTIQQLKTKAHKL